MTNAARTTLATLVLIVAVVLALVGTGAHWVDRAARTPRPLQQILAPLAADPRVHDSLTAGLVDAASEQVPGLTGAVPALGEQVESLVATAVRDAMADEAVARAWATSVDLSRRDAVTALDALAAADGDGDAPTLWLHVGPFVDLAQDRLLEATPPVLRGVVAGLDWPSGLRLALGRPDPQQAAWAADALQVARGWVWFYVAAVALALVGMAVGPRRGRWVAWTVAVALGIAALTLARRVAVDVAAPAATADGLAAAVQRQVVTGAASSLLDWTDPVVGAFWGLAALGVVGFLASLGPRRGAR